MTNASLVKLRGKKENILLTDFQAIPMIWIEMLEAFNRIYIFISLYKWWRLQSIEVF